MKPRFPINACKYVYSFVESYASVFSQTSSMAPVFATPEATVRYGLRGLDLSSQKIAAVNVNLEVLGTAAPDQFVVMSLPAEFSLSCSSVYVLDYTCLSSLLSHPGSPSPSLLSSLPLLSVSLALCFFPSPSPAPSPPPPPRAVAALFWLFLPASWPIEVHVLREKLSQDWLPAATFRWNDCAFLRERGRDASLVSLSANVSSYSYCLMRVSSRKPSTVL